jgi:hypothetical protein
MTCKEESKKGFINQQPSNAVLNPIVFFIGLYGFYANWNSVLPL